MRCLVGRRQVQARIDDGSLPEEIRAKLIEVAQRGDLMSFAVDALCDHRVLH
jgi:hypothetical protein